MYLNIVLQSYTERNLLHLYLLELISYMITECEMRGLKELTEQQPTQVDKASTIPRWL